MSLVDRYAELRGLAYGIAYRMLGTASDAEDAVQDAFVRLQGPSGGAAHVRDAEAFVATVTTRAAIDRLRSAHRRREEYVGTWLPEPLLTEHVEPDPAVPAMRADSLSTAALLLLERLSPVERAVFVLREMFDYGYDEIAAVVDKTEANCRQIFVRANRRVGDDRPRFETSAAERRRLVQELVAACERGDLDGLVDLLAEDVAFQADGGGKVRAYPRLVRGPVPAGRLLLAMFRSARERGLAIGLETLNRQPGLVVRTPDGRAAAALSFHVPRRVRAIQSVLNPDKLGGVDGTRMTALV
jgi:RNA polymerase sigma-70 factor, ECF subfamily